MQGKLARDPYEALGLFGSPTAADIRQAFLQLTKQFHPARFGRMTPDIQRMANEVFLGLRAAHDKLATPSSRPGAKPGLPTVARTATSPLSVRTGAGPVPPVRSAQGNQANRMSSIPDAVPTAIGEQPSQRASLTGGASPLAPTSGSQRTTATGGTSRLASSADSREAPPAHGDANRPGMPAPSSAARASTTPSSRSGGSTTTTPPRAGAYGVRIAPATQPVGTPPRPTTPRAHPVDARAAGPAGGGSASPPVSASAPALAPLVALIEHGQFAAAKSSLETMISRDPGNVRLLALLVYARGREAQLARRMDEARVELQEALQIDPSLELARIALGELFTRRK